MSEPVKAAWIVLRRDNGHFESLGPGIEIFDSEEKASAHAEARAAKQPEITFAVLCLHHTWNTEPRLIRHDVKGDKP